MPNTVSVALPLLRLSDLRGAVCHVGKKYVPGPRADLPTDFAFCRIGAHGWLGLLLRLWASRAHGSLIHAVRVQAVTNKDLVGGRI
jgi:hypothetical protein